MPGKRRRDAVDVLVGGCLDWNDSAHWASPARPCRHCGTPTHLRNAQRQHACKVCEETWLSSRIEQVAATYVNGRLTR